MKIGIDGGGTKTECILVDASGTVIAMHVGAGCNPNVVGPQQAASIVVAALESLRAQADAHAGGATRAPFGPASIITSTLLCMSGRPAFWQRFGNELQGYGRVTTVDDSLPVLELATHGRPGLVLHAGTGSFVAARAPDGTAHYAGGLGWRFGDAGSGYELGRLAIARALLELQGWMPPTRLAAVVRDHAQLGADATPAALTHHFYDQADPNRTIASLAPAVLTLAGEGDRDAREIILASADELLALAGRVATKLFPAALLGTVSAGLSGPILTHPAVVPALAMHSSLALAPIDGTPIEGVRRLLAREGLAPV